MSQLAKCSRCGEEYPPDMIGWQLHELVHIDRDEKVLKGFVSFMVLLIFGLILYGIIR